MTIKNAARPLCLLALFSTLACDDGGSDTTDGSTGGTPTTTDAPTTDAPTTDAPTTVGETTGGPDETTGGPDETTTDEPTGGSETTDPGDSTGAAGTGYADLLGDYSDDFGGTHTLEAGAWTQDYGDGNPLVLEIEQVDDAAQWVLGPAAKGAPTPGYQRIDWFETEAGLWMCTAAFGTKTAEEAMDAPASDTADLEGVGCGGMFPWTRLTMQ